MREGERSYRGGKNTKEKPEERVIRGGRGGFWLLFSAGVRVVESWERHS